jgi:hypothetical protein
MPATITPLQKPKQASRNLTQEIEGLNDVQVKILRLFGPEVCRLYQISTG